MGRKASSLVLKEAVKVDLENQELLRRAVPPLAKRFGFTKEEAWKLLIEENQDGSLHDLVSGWRNPEVRGQVNDWWKQYHPEFSEFGLGEFRRLSSASKVESELAYKQLICLTWLTDALQAEMARRWAERWIRPLVPELPRVPTVPEVLVVPRVPEVPTIPSAPKAQPFWQRVVEWFRSILRRR